MIALAVNNRQEVTQIHYVCEHNPDDMILVESIPQVEPREGFGATLMYDSERGLYYRYDPLPEVLEPEPEPQRVPAELREQAYREQADQYLTAYAGYMLEGKTAEAETQKTLYLAAKTEIRKRFPENYEN